MSSLGERGSLKGCLREGAFFKERALVADFELR